MACSKMKADLHHEKLSKEALRLSDNLKATSKDWRIHCMCLCRFIEARVLFGHFYINHALTKGG